jgi:hypothetical protein
VGEDATVPVVVGGSVLVGGGVVLLVGGGLVAWCGR